MEYTKKLFKLAALFEAKLADTDPNSAKKLVKDTIESIWDNNPTVMDGFVYVSNIQVNGNTVSFVLNLDKDKPDVVAKNKPQRDNLINAGVKNALKSKYNQDFDLGYTEVMV